MASVEVAGKVWSCVYEGDKVARGGIADAFATDRLGRTQVAARRLRVTRDEIHRRQVGLPAVHC